MRTDTDGARVTDLFTDVRDALRAAGIPRELKDGLDRRLTSIFEHARAMRNNSGHPTADRVDSDDALAGLIVFPGLYTFVDKLLLHL